VIGSVAQGARDAPLEDVHHKPKLRLPAIARNAAAHCGPTIASVASVAHLRREIREAKDSGSRETVPLLSDLRKKWAFDLEPDKSP
jgi:hypothetical protein